MWPPTPSPAPRLHHGRRRPRVRRAVASRPLLRHARRWSTRPAARARRRPARTANALTGLPRRRLPPLGDARSRRVLFRRAPQTGWPSGFGNIAEHDPPAGRPMPGPQRPAADELVAPAASRCIPTSASIIRRWRPHRGRGASRPRQPPRRAQRRRRAVQRLAQQRRWPTTGRLRRVIAFGTAEAMKACATRPAPE